MRVSPSSSTGRPDVLPTSVAARKLGPLRTAPRFWCDLVPGSGPGAFWSLLRRLPRGFLLASPLRAVEKVFSGLYAVLAPPALRVRATGLPLEILSGEAVASLQLVKTGGEAFAGASHDGVRFLLSARSVLAVTCFGELSVDLVSDLRIFSF